MLQTLYDATDEEIIEACKLAAAHDFVESFPEKYDTYIEQGGTNVSGGQKQRLCIARALLKKPKILILDEPTASLDPIAEQEIFNQFDQLRRDKTTIFVSHRLSSATIASKIIVLEYGELVEEGTHRELMDKKGKYYELFSTQVRRYVENDVK